MVTTDLDLDAVTVDAFLADSVVVADGKLYVQGAGWDTIVTAVFPFRQSRIGIGVLLRIPWTATNKMHDFSVKIVDPDENEVALADPPPGTELADGAIRELRGQFNVGRPPMLTMGDSQVVPIAMNLDGIVFAEPSTYNVVIAVDNDVMRRLPIRILAQTPRMGA